MTRNRLNTRQSNPGQGTSLAIKYSAGRSAKEPRTAHETQLQYRFKRWLEAGSLRARFVYRISGRLLRVTDSPVAIDVSRRSGGRWRAKAFSIRTAELGDGAVFLLGAQLTTGDLGGTLSSRTVRIDHEARRREWLAMIDGVEIRNRTELARQLGVSPTQVSRVLGPA